MNEFEPNPHLDVVVDRLAEELSGVFSEGTIRRYVYESATAWRNVPITSFVPALTERFARERLRALAHTEGN
jgi:hypothetical protein